jgi:integrase
MKRNKLLLPSGCSCSTPSVNPSNWKSCNKSALKKDWYICYYFYDSEFPKPKQVIVKGMNEYKELDDRRNATKVLLENELHSLKVKGYNPFTKKYFIPQQIPKGELHPDLFFIEALEIVYPKLSIKDSTRSDIRQVVNGVKKSAKQLRFDYKIKEIHSGHVRDLLDNLKLTNNRFNKFLTYLSIVFSELSELRVVTHNPIRDIRKRKVTKKIREILTTEKFKMILEHLRVNNYTFYRYANIFFFSGARSTELFSIKRKDVNLEKQEYKITIEKGREYKEVIKIILPNSLPFWTEVVQECENENDYLFTVNLSPGSTATQSYQITKRWKRLIKDKMVFKDGKLIAKYNLEIGDIEFEAITEDFYSLKHSFLDSLPIEQAQRMASHTSFRTTEIYQVGKQRRDREELKLMKVTF